MSLYIIVAIALASLLGGFGGAWKVQDWRYGAKEAERMEVEAEKRRMDAKQIHAAATGYEADKRKLREQSGPIIKEVERVVEKPVYRNICLDDDGLRVLDDALGIAKPASEPAGAVPRPVTP